MSAPRVPSQPASESRTLKLVILYAATSNPGKLREFRDCAQASGLTVETLPGLAEMPEPAEDAATFMGNAEIKATAYSLRAPGLLVFADDSGLEVDALDGKPGVRSARFAEDLGFQAVDASDRNARNLRALLHLLSGVPSDRRRARFRCALALTRDGEVLERAEGVVEGHILATARGVGGFGYDPVFLPVLQAQTLAEMPPALKWSLSHRGNAFRALLDRIRGGVD